MNITAGYLVLTPFDTEDYGPVMAPLWILLGPPKRVTLLN